MTPKLAGTAALVTGASSGIGAATARRLAQDGACVALVARRLDRLQALAADIENAGGTALAVEADITDRAQAEAAVEQAAGRFGRLDILVNNAGLMLLGPVAGADPQEWDQMIAVNVQGLLSTTRAALPHLLQAAEQGPRRVADMTCTCSKMSWSIVGGWTIFSDQIQAADSFQRSLVVWPSATSSTSMSSSSLRCLLQTWSGWTRVRAASSCWCRRTTTGRRCRAATTPQLRPRIGGRARPDCARGVRTPFRPGPRVAACYCGERPARRTPATQEGRSPQGTRWQAL
jgi:NAD(P)-dependent dehydrogenase (short-subunit alcohol dehydrogenase family)